MNAKHLPQSSALAPPPNEGRHCIIQAARAPDRWMIYVHSRKNRRACRGHSVSKVVARQMLSVGLQGLAGSSQLRCNLNTLVLNSYCLDSSTARCHLQYYVQWIYYQIYLCAIYLSLFVYTGTHMKYMCFFLYAAQLTVFMLTLRMRILRSKRKGRLGQIRHCYSHAAQVKPPELNRCKWGKNLALAFRQQGQIWDTENAVSILSVFESQERKSPRNDENIHRSKCIYMSVKHSKWYNHTVLQQMHNISKI